MIVLPIRDSGGIAERPRQIAFASPGEAAVEIGDCACIKSDCQAVIGDGSIPISSRQSLVAAFEVRSS